MFEKLKGPEDLYRTHGKLSEKLAKRQEAANFAAKVVVNVKENSGGTFTGEPTLQGDIDRAWAERKYDSAADSLSRAKERYDANLAIAAEKNSDGRYIQPALREAQREGAQIDASRYS